METKTIYVSPPYLEVEVCPYLYMRISRCLSVFIVLSTYPRILPVINFKPFSSARQSSPTDVTVGDSTGFFVKAYEYKGGPGMSRPVEVPFHQVTAHTDHYYLAR